MHWFERTFEIFVMICALRHNTPLWHNVLQQNAKWKFRVSLSRFGILSNRVTRPTRRNCIVRSCWSETRSLQSQPIEWGHDPKVVDIRIGQFMPRRMSWKNWAIRVFSKDALCLSVALEFMRTDPNPATSANSFSKNVWINTASRQLPIENTTKFRIKLRFDSLIGIIMSEWFKISIERKRNKSPLKKCAPAEDRTQDLFLTNGYKRNALPLSY